MVIEPLAGVYKPVITQPLQNVLFLFVEICVIICLVWAGSVMTGLDTPTNIPLIWGFNHHFTNYNFKQRLLSNNYDFHLSIPLTI